MTASTERVDTSDWRACLTDIFNRVHEFMLPKTWDSVETIAECIYFSTRQLGITEKPGVLAFTAVINCEVMVSESRILQQLGVGREEFLKNSPAIFLGEFVPVEDMKKRLPAYRIDEPIQNLINATNWEEERIIVLRFIDLEDPEKGNDLTTRVHKSLLPPEKQCDCPVCRMRRSQAPWHSGAEWN